MKTAKTVAAHKTQFQNMHSIPKCKKSNPKKAGFRLNR